jgi:hypothetical protein
MGKIISYIPPSANEKIGVSRQAVSKWEGGLHVFFDPALLSSEAGGGAL